MPSCIETYELDQPTRVTVFSDRVEILSPGPLPHAVDPEKFRAGKASPFWRNQSLAYFVNKLQFAQAEGQGIPTILRVMKEEGNPDPRFDIDEEQVICTLPTHPRHALMRRLIELENMMILGKHSQVKVELQELLDQDPYNFRSIELYCEVCNLLHTQDDVYRFVTNPDIDIQKINPSTRIVIAETLLSRKTPEFLEIAEKLMSDAYKGKFEESEIKKIAINLRKMGSNERAIEFINSMIDKFPHLSNNASLLELRAKSKIDLAKICMDTGRNKETSKNIRRKAWDHCRSYLNSAELDLNKALEHVILPWEKEFIRDDYNFLKRMKYIARRPRKKRSKKRKATNQNSS